MARLILPRVLRLLLLPLLFFLWSSGPAHAVFHDRVAGPCPTLLGFEITHRFCVPAEDGGWAVTIIDFFHEPAVSLYNALGSTTACIVCQLLTTILSAVEPIGSSSYRLLVVPSAIFLGVGLAIVLTLGAGRILLSPVQSQRPWTDLAASTVRFLIALVLLGSAASISGGSVSTAPGVPGASAGDPFTVIYGRIVDPLLGTSVALGMVLLDSVTVGSIAGAPVAATGDGPLMAHARREADLQNGGPSTGLKGLMVYAAGLHLIGRLGMAQGIGFLSDARLVPEGGSRWIAFIAGVLLVLLFAVFLVVSGLRLIDPLIRVLLVISLAPLLIVAWVFGPTRQAARVGLRVFAYAFFFFVIAGLVYGIAFTLLTQSSRAVYGVSDDTLLIGCASPPVEPPAGPQVCFCKATLLVTFDGLARCMLFNGGSLTRIPDSAGVVRPSIDMTRVVISVIALLLSQSLIALVSSLAGTFSDYSASDNIAQGAESQMRGLATSAVHTSVYAGVTVAKTLAGGVKRSLFPVPGA